MASLLEIVEAMADALAPVKTAIPELQVYPYLNQNPTPPSIDMYPADLFETASGFGDDLETYWTVRARTTTADHEAGQKALLRMLDSRGPESVEDALRQTRHWAGSPSRSRSPTRASPATATTSKTHKPTAA